VLEAAVLFEAGWEDLVDEVWVVSVDTEVAIERLMRRNQFTREQALERVRSQLDPEEREKRADRVIPNSSDEAALRAVLEREYATLT